MKPQKHVVDIVQDGTKPLSIKKRELFCHEYVVDGNATQAAVRAGYSARSAGSQAHDLLKNHDVKARIAYLDQERIKKSAKEAERLGITPERVVDRMAEIAFADPAEIARVVVISCRYCHGLNGGYQWIDEAEFESALARFARTKGHNPKYAGSEPIIDGGFGYLPKLDPNPTCPHCMGAGQSRVVLGDTERLSPGAKALFAGAKEGQHGIEVKFHSQMDALKQLAEITGARKGEGEALSEIGEVIKEVNRIGSTAPIRSQRFRDGRAANEA